MRLIDADAIPSMGISNFSVMFREVIDNMPTVDLWHYPSKGEYPTETDDYLVYVNTKAVRGQKIMAIATYYVGAKEWNIDTDEYEFKYPPIAWMPLPDPPKEEA